MKTVETLEAGRLRIERHIKQNPNKTGLWRLLDRIDEEIETIQKRTRRLSGV